MVSTNSNINFEKLNFDPFQLNNTLLDNLSDSDFNIFNENLQSINTTYFQTEECSQYLSNINQNSFSLLHVNIRSINKNFEKLKLMLSEVNFNFKIIVLTETWNKDQNIMNNSLFRLQNYKIVHQDRKGKKQGGGVCIFVHNSLNYRICYDMSHCVDDIESLCVEIINKQEKMLLLLHYIDHRMVKLNPSNIT